MIKVKEALRKVSLSAKRRDSDPPPQIIYEDNKTVPLPVSISNTKELSGSYPTLNESTHYQNISYEEILNVRKITSPRRKSENLIDFLNLDCKGAELSALLAENSDKAKEPLRKTKSYCDNGTSAIPTRRNSLQGLLLKQSKSSKLRTRRANMAHSYEPNKLLSKAIADGYADLVVGLLQSGQVNINKLNNDGYAPLHLAAFEDKADIIRILINHGAFIDILDSTGFSPLEVSVNEGSFECAQVLIENGADQTLILDGHFDKRRSRASSMDDEYQKYLKTREARQ